MNTANPSNVEENLKKLAEIREKNPSATHVYIRRCDKDNLVVDIPIDHAEFTIRNRPKWEVVSSNKQMDDVVEALFREPEELPVEVKPDYFEVVDLEIVVPPKPSEIKKDDPNSKRRKSRKAKGPKKA